MHRIQILPLVALIVILPGWAFGMPISVEIVPSTPSTSSSVFLETTLEWGNGGYDLIGSSVTFLSAYELQVDITISSPAPGEFVPAFISSLGDSAYLGLLPAGTYSYTVIETDVQRLTGYQSWGGSLSGTFNVVPEPSTMALALLSLAGLAAWQRTQIRRMR